MSDPSLFSIAELIAALQDDALGSGEGFGDDFGLELEVLGPLRLKVAAFRGTEQMNALYAFDVVFLVPLAEGVDVGSESLGRRARLFMSTPAGPRVVHGIAALVELCSLHREHRVYRLRLVPQVWLLSKTTDSRVFQDMTVPEVIGEVLNEHRIQHLFGLVQPRTPRRHCVQYEETDLAFVTRLAAEEGIFFCFDHFASVDEARKAGAEEATERMLFGDTKALYAPIAGSPLLHYVAGGVGALGGRESDVTHFRAASSVQSNAASVRGYDYTLATFRGPDRGPPDPGPPDAGPGDSGAGVPDAIVARGILRAGAAAPAGAAGRLEIFEHHDDYEDIVVSPLIARTRLEQHRASAVEGTAVTWCRRLSPGRSFRLAGHDVAALDQEYAVTRVRHEGHGRRDTKIPVYRCEVSCVPADVPFRPPRPGRRMHQAVETGVVVGPASEEIETERHGCVRVQFHWDRRGRHDERSSCWIRVMQPWAGPAYGFSFVPRIGMEVLVSFVGGDLDRPVVIGCMPNPGNTPPVVLPENKTQSAIRTHTVPGDVGGYNEILFEDKQGGELLALRSERNHEVVVNHDHIVRVGHDQTSLIGANRHAKITLNDEAAVVGDRIRTVGGTSIDEVAGDAKLAFGRSRVVHVAADDEVRIGGGRTEMVGDHLTTVVGRLGVEGDILSMASGTHRVVAAKEIRLESPASIRLVCGSSSIVLRADGIELSAERITLKGEKAVDTKVNDSELRIGERVEVIAKEIAQRSSGAAVVLDAAAKVTPAWVPNAVGPDGKPRKEGPKSPGVATFKLEVPPGEKGPFTLHIATPKGDVVERETDENFEVKMDGEDGDTFVLVEVKRGDRTLAHAPKQS